MNNYIWLLIALFISTSSIFASSIEPLKSPLPVSTYLTFQSQNTANAITVNVYLKNKLNKAQIHFGETSKSAQKNLYPYKQSANITYISKANRSVASFHLKNLKANTVYFFVVSSDEFITKKEYKFRTLPSDSSPVQIIQGGDMGTSDVIPKIINSSLTSEPHAILIGGDIAYANGDFGNTNKWDDWFGLMNQSMTTAKGFLIPLILAIGNHEVNLFALKDKVAFFYKLFPQNNDTPYFKRSLGSHSMLYVLDSGHDSPPFGKQAKWLKKQLKQDNKIVNKLALYHIPLYPSHRSYNGPQSIVVRSSWLRYFDRYDLKVAFENHDHTLKRTHLLRDGKVVEKNGVLYLGDGCWGKNSRQAERRWYLKTSLEQTHVWNLTLKPNLIFGQAEGIKGQIYDSFSLITDIKTSILKDEINNFN